MQDTHDNDYENVKFVSSLKCRRKSRLVVDYASSKILYEKLVIRELGMEESHNRESDIWKISMINLLHILKNRFYSEEFEKIVRILDNFLSDMNDTTKEQYIVASARILVTVMIQCREKRLKKTLSTTCLEVLSCYRELQGIEMYASESQKIENVFELSIFGGSELDLLYLITLVDSRIGACSSKRKFDSFEYLCAEYDDEDVRNIDFMFMWYRYFFFVCKMMLDQNFKTIIQIRRYEGVLYEQIKNITKSMSKSKMLRKT